MRWKIAIAIAIVIGAGSSWLGLKYHRCQSRGAALGRQIESIKKDALERLKVGAGKADVSRFFDEHGMPFDIVDSEAFGTLHASGCAPWMCGTDSAIIRVRVKLDGAGAVAQEPIVGGVYTDCP